ncbi:MAG: hypothetical protein JST08_12390 [Actinobacteria bacterium]|nr:hypothetical protein [Actinomycetota bacterium]
MPTADTIRTTPLTGRVDRRDERVRLIEESVLLIRGDWPAVAIGLCEQVNRSAGLIVRTPRDLDQAIERTCAEALRLVQDLYGREAVREVERLAAAGAAPTPEPAPAVRHRRLHLPRPHRGIRAHAG